MASAVLGAVEGAKAFANLLPVGAASAAGDIVGDAADVLGCGQNRWSMQQTAALHGEASFTVSALSALKV